MLRVLATLIVLTFAAPVFADGTGWLHLRRFDDLAIQEGVQHANLYAFDEAGSPVAGGAGGTSHAAGAYVEVPAGWYFVSVGTRFSRHNTTRLQVVEDRVTVVPSGWVSVLTVPPEEQPSAGCSRWTAELTVSVVAPDGTEEVVASNSGAGAAGFGMVQVAARPLVAHFNGFPVAIDVRPDQELRLPTGYQDPVQGERTQISLRDTSEGGNVTMSLCTDGALHVPAGNYFTSSIVRADTYPFERRTYQPVVVEPWDWTGYGPLRIPTLEHRQHTGEGSEGGVLGPEWTQQLETLGQGARPRLPGLGRP